MITDRFTMNGYLWKIEFVIGNDPMLVDRTGDLKVATTDFSTLTVYLSEELYGDFLMTVFVHELGHCAMYSYGFLDEIHRMVYPEYWIDMEEFICNFLADYGLRIFRTAYRTMGYQGWKEIPRSFEKQFA